LKLHEILLHHFSKYDNCIELQVELSYLEKAYDSLVDQMNTIFSQRLWYVMLEQFLMKYVWSGTGMIMVSLPILTSSRREGE